MGKCAILAAISGMLLASVIAADAEGASFWYRHKVPGIVVFDSSGNTRPMIVGVPSGLTVEAGQTLAAVEAMKMENVLRAERRAVVKTLATRAGASLAVDELIMEFE